MNSLTHIFKALGDDTRLRIIDLLLTHDLCVGALAKRLGISGPAVSQHLKVMRKSGLVRGEKRGYWTHYSIDRNTLYEIANEITKRAERFSSSEGACLRSITSETNLNERGDIAMCKDCCQQPENLKGKPEECSPEQIRKCHGDTKNHPCVKGEQKDDSDC